MYVRYVFVIENIICQPLYLCICHKDQWLLRMWLAKGLVVRQGIGGFQVSPNETVEETAKRQLNQIIQVARLGNK